MRKIKASGWYGTGFGTGGAKAAKELGIPEETIHIWLKAVRAGRLDTVNILHSLVPISQFDKRKATQIFDRLRTEKELIVLKNNQPSAVILSLEEYTRLTEIEEDYMLLLEANSILKANREKPAVSFKMYLVI